MVWHIHHQKPTLEEYPNAKVIHTIYTKVCGHPFKLVDSASSPTPVADRCIKSSTPPCNLHRQTLAVEWPYWRAHWLSTWHCHRMPPFQQVSLSIFALQELPWSTVCAVIVKWKRFNMHICEKKHCRCTNVPNHKHQCLSLKSANRNFF